MAGKLFAALVEQVEQIQDNDTVSAERKAVLQPLVDYIQQRVDAGEWVNLNFVCTHNSRRSHLTQIWAQMASAYYGIPRVTCYSGGTEATALYPAVVDTLRAQGFQIAVIAEGSNPIYAIKYGANVLPIVGFSKAYDDSFNPSSDFAAVMTCSQADDGCPFIAGADKRFAVRYEDPKISDATAEQKAVYAGRSLEIGAEMVYVFSRIKK